MEDRRKDEARAGAISRLPANIGLLAMVVGVVGVVYFAPRYREETLLQADVVETLDAIVWRIEDDRSMLTYVFEVGDRHYRRTVKATQDEIDAASRKRRVRVRYWTLGPSVSAIDRRVSIDLHLRRSQILISATIALGGVILAFCVASWEHVDPLLKARREQRSIPMPELKKVLHNLAVLTTLVVGVAGGAGFVLTDSYQPCYAEQRWYYGIALYSGIIGFIALQRWTPFRTDRHEW